MPGGISCWRAGLSLFFLRQPAPRFCWCLVAPESVLAGRRAVLGHVSSGPSQAVVLVSALTCGVVWLAMAEFFYPLPDATSAVSCQRGRTSCPEESRAMPGSVGRRREG